MKVSLGPRALALPAPVWLVGSYDQEGRANAMAASWAGVCCSEPPCIAVAVRPERYSHHGIVAHGAFTVSVPSVDQVAAVEVFGSQSGRYGDKFAAAGLSPQPSALVTAPYVAECPVVMECRVRQAIDLGSHTLFVGEVLDSRTHRSSRRRASSMPRRWTPSCCAVATGPSADRCLAEPRAAP